MAQKKSDKGRSSTTGPKKSGATKSAVEKSTRTKPDRNKSDRKKSDRKKSDRKKVSTKADPPKAASTELVVDQALRPVDGSQVPPPLPAPRPGRGKGHGRRSVQGDRRDRAGSRRPDDVVDDRPAADSRKRPPADHKAYTARDAFRFPAGAAAPDLPTDLLDLGPQDEKAAVKATEDLADKLSDLQERLQAQGAAGNRERVLLILQGMDTSGKDGVTKTVFDATNPLGLHLASFKKPTAEERAHDFLWRIEKQVPQAGQIGVFNRSHYEDVLVVRVHDLVPQSEWSTRYAAINAFERKLVRQGVTVVKCFLHVSKQVQKERLAARLDDPEKWWKYNPGDIDERAFWDDYQDAYTDLLRRCSTVGAPWYVIPADHKWYRNWAVAAVLTEVLTELDPQFPPAGFDVAGEKARLALA